MVLFKILDKLVNFICYPIEMFSNFLNSVYSFYLIKITDLHVSFLILFSENQRESFLLTCVLVVFHCVTDFDFYVWSPILDFLIHLPLSYLFNFIRTFLYTNYFQQLNHVSYNAVFTSLKFILLTALLVFVRGGIPRYRFDYLTKLGWTKFLSLIVLSFLLELYLLWIF